MKEPASWPEPVNAQRMSPRDRIRAFGFGYPRRPGVTLRRIQWFGFSRAGAIALALGAEERWRRLEAASEAEASKRG